MAPEADRVRKIALEVVPRCSASQAILHTLLRLASKQVEIFLLLPLGDLGVVARELGPLDGNVVIDEALPEAFGKAAILGQRRERLLERLGQERRLGLV